MEKEQKKLLLVAVSVGVFLLVTITAAIIILTPKAPAEATAFTSSQPYPAGRGQSESITITPVTPAVVESEIAPISEEITIADKVEGDNLTIQIPKPTTAAVPDIPELSVPAAPKPVVTAAAEKPAPVAKPATTAKPAAATKPATSTKPASAIKPAKATNDYWVQTGAFTAKVRAEDAKETLASKGITSIIENRNVDGKTWYRVRLGPYTSEKEANYWLALVKSIDGFIDSQVRQTVRQQ